MKRILLLLFILVSLLQARASDTLTVRQVFNFNVGDTFDYQIILNLYDGNTPYTFSGSNYERYVIIAKYISSDGDTIKYIRQQIYPNSSQIDHLVYFNLDSPIWLAFDTSVTSPYLTINIDSFNSGPVTNSLTFSDSNEYFSCSYGNGLGVIDTSYGSFSTLIPGSDPEQYMGGSYEKKLIYFSEDSIQYGTPYYQAIGPNLTHFTPIPEECAFWNYYSGYYSGTSQIRTGNKIYLNNHTYVELVYRTFFNGQLSNDTTVGYFRNDTIGRKIYFTQYPGSAEAVLYDFTLTDSSQIYTPSYYNLIVDTISIGGTRLSRWIQEVVNSNFNFEFYNYIEGIGSTSSLFFAPNDYGGCPGFCIISLTSFCVCGQTIYPDTASGQCQLLTGINNIPSTSSIKAYPNPTTDQLHLSITDAGIANAKFIITNILGQEVYSSTITQSETTHDISGLAAGIYTWSIVEDQTTIKTGKVVKE